MKDARAIQQLFERYQRERTAFAGSVYELARHDSNCELLEGAGGGHFLEGLLNDPIIGIRRTATLAIGRLAAQSEAVSNKIIATGAVRTLTALLATPISDAPVASAETSRRREGLELRRAAAFTLRNACKHSKTITNAIVEAGALQAATACLLVTDAETREGAAWLVDSIAARGEDLAESVIESNALVPLVSCMEYSEVALKRAAASALGSVAQHGPKFAQAVAAAGALTPLASLLNSGDSVDLRLARHALCALSQIVQGGKDLASALVATGALPAVVRHLASTDELVQRFAASTLRDVACHSGSLAQEVASTQHCLQLLVHATNQSRGLNALPFIMALGYLCAGSPALAEVVIASGGLTALAVAIAHNKEEPAKCAAAWAVGQAGRHGSTQAQAVAESGALLALTELEIAPSSSEDLAAKCNKASCSVIAELTALPSLDALLRMPVSSAVKFAVLGRLAAVLSADSGALKASFVQTGGLQLAQELGEEPNSPYQTIVARITELFPIELVNRYSPAYNRALLERLTLGANAPSEPATVQPPQSVYSTWAPPATFDPPPAPVEEQAPAPAPAPAPIVAAREEPAVMAPPLLAPPPPPPAAAGAIDELPALPATYLSTIEEEPEPQATLLAAPVATLPEPETVVGLPEIPVAAAVVLPTPTTEAPAAVPLPSPRPKPKTPRKAPRTSEKEVPTKEISSAKSPAIQPPVARTVAPAAVRKSVLNAALPITPRDILPSTSAE